MYILGLSGRPDTFTCKGSKKDFLTSIDATLNKKYQDARGQHIFFFVHIPDASRVWVTGVKGKQDTFCAYTTSEEAQTQREKYAKFYGIKEVYMISFGDDDNDK
jgi:hypothetical protein